MVNLSNLTCDKCGKKFNYNEDTKSQVSWILGREAKDDVLKDKICGECIEKEKK